MTVPRRWSALFCGSVLVVAGSSVAGLYSFRGNVSVVFVGFCLFVVGYYVARDGRAVLSGLRERSDTAARSDHPVVRGGLLLVGVYGIAKGVTLFSQTVLDPGVGSAVEAGLYSIGGYAWAHVVIHQQLF